MKTVEKSSFISIKTLYEIKRVVFDFLRIDSFCVFLEKKTRIRPNHITVFNWLFGGLALYYLYFNHVGFLIVMIIHVLLDNLDGYYARSRGLQTKLGEGLDHLGDFIYGELFLLKGWLVYQDWWILLAMGLFFAEGAILIKWGLYREKFPWRAYIFFFIFGYYKLGLAAQVICQPLSFLVFLWFRRRFEKKMKIIDSTSSFKPV